MFIQGALANINREVSTDDLLRFLSVEVPQGIFFKFQPPPGTTVAAAIDWRALLYDAAAVATIATALWSAYDKFVKPIHEKDPSSSAAIFIQMKNDAGESDQFMIGGDIRDKEVLIQRFQESTARLKLNSSESVPGEELEEIKRSGYWVKIQ
ncbi:hypothetical protein [Aquitalea sp.]|uniref:hypothetical protein n=1 Tax=Aquitalea sp. TaxID=1872623 RepID=UPI00258DCF30|nr:hypothetical protein [Aquitalea sp.]